jgi:hypothetical protein
MAELLVTAPEINFITAIRRFAARAVYMDVLYDDAMGEVRLKTCRGLLGHDVNTLSRTAQ